MEKRVRQRIVTDHPDYVEISELLNAAAITWPRWGLSAADLAQLDPYEREIIYLKL